MSVFNGVPFVGKGVKTLDDGVLLFVDGELVAEPFVKLLRLVRLAVNSAAVLGAIAGCKGFENGGTPCPFGRLGLKPAKTRNAFCPGNAQPGEIRSLLL